VPQQARVGLARLSGGLLPLLNDALPHRLVPVLREFLATEAGATDAGVLLADYELRELRRLSPRPQEDLTVTVAGTAAGRCFLSQTVITAPAAGGAGGAAGAVQVLVPLSLRAERFGVLQVALSGPVSQELLQGLQDVALATVYVLVACGGCSDVVEVARRAEPLSVAAEMQWSLQPLRAFGGERFAIAGQLSPAYEVGGDCYDYNVDAEHLDLSSLDAMGHGVRASLLAGLATAVMRNARRAGHGPVEQVRHADRQLLEQFGGAQFVTALAIRLDLGSGNAEIVNAGHPAPWLVRAGKAVAVELDPQLPAGMFQATDYRGQALRLEPADRLVLITDGVLEAGAPHEEFGEDRLGELLLATAGLPPHQCVAEVLHTVRSHTPRMHDDATVICLDWLGPGGLTPG
jgi:serine phosphatase RsbU (regulator of sigma subunit)